MYYWYMYALEDDFSLALQTIKGRRQNVNSDIEANAAAAAGAGIKEAAHSE